MCLNIASSFFTMEYTSRISYVHIGQYYYNFRLHNSVWHFLKEMTLCRALTTTNTINKYGGDEGAVDAG